MQKSVQARKNRIISAMSGQFQSELPIFKTNRNTNRNLTKESDYVGKAILAAIVTLIVGYLGMVVGLEFLGNWVEFGLLIAIAVMGAFIIYFNDKKK